ncbi:hypothetical protein [Paenibacillus elgii]|uniref:hypothetical protein n=1 Tax=Paenibacillus elgii TaxID=189691 RepID=UPI0039F63A3E
MPTDEDSTPAHIGDVRHFEQPLNRAVFAERACSKGKTTSSGAEAPDTLIDASTEVGWAAKNGWRANSPEVSDEPSNASASTDSGRRRQAVSRMPVPLLGYVKRLHLVFIQVECFGDGHAVWSETSCSPDLPP